MKVFLSQLGREPNAMIKYGLGHTCHFVSGREEECIQEGTAERRKGRSRTSHPFSEEQILFYLSTFVLSAAVSFDEKCKNIHSGNETKVLHGESICLRIEQSSLNCSKMIK